MANKVVDSRRKQGVPGVLYNVQDLEKAYNHVNWKFLDSIMLEMGLWGEVEEIDQVLHFCVGEQ